jgi:hypothetical protein
MGLKNLAENKQFSPPQVQTLQKGSSLRLENTLHKYQEFNLLWGKKKFKPRRKRQDMNITRRIALYFFGLSLILLIGEFPLWGAEDYLAKFGVSRVDKTVDAPGFTLPDLKGRKRSLSDFQGKFVILNFWATW